MIETKDNYLWWQTQIIYQVYPRSFQDSNNDGIGDLRGILKRLDYLEWLGISAIWLSPVYPSPMADFGYDISDYTNIDPLFGTMEDFDELLDEIHRRNMKLIIDFVPNHTSNQHPWFLESRSSRNNSKRDWYIWEDARPDGSPPNNWLSVFGGSGWEWDAHTNQYYYHAFLKEQPDLNWRNPDVRKAMLSVMRFWLDKGVDGFRVDVMWHMIKDKQLRDNPSNPAYQQQMATYEQLLPVYSTDQPEVHEIVREMRKLLDQYDERMMIGEIYLPIYKLVMYYGSTENKGAHLPFNFLLLSIAWNAPEIAAAINEYVAALPEDGWPNWVLGNHDQHRLISRLGLSQAKVAAMLLLTLHGTPTIYYGDEIGMADVAIPPEEILDPQGLNMPGKNLSRDPQRTPMQWNNGKYAGFSETRPWLRIETNYAKNNVESQKEDPLSVLAFYKRLIKLRQQEMSLMIGRYTPVFTDQQIIAFTRSTANADSFLIVLNLNHHPCYFNPPHFNFKGKVVVATSLEWEGKDIDTVINLAGDEAMIIRLID
jgi:alpha-glucosidase